MTNEKRYGLAVESLNCDLTKFEDALDGELERGVGYILILVDGKEIDGMYANVIGSNIDMAVAKNLLRGFAEKVEVE